jgi:hypothetical protein
MDNSVGGVSGRRERRRSEKEPDVQAGEVVDIILDSEHPAYSTVTDIGKIKFRPLVTGYNKAIESLGWAKPLEVSIKQFPLIHETVILIKAPSGRTGTVIGSMPYSYLPMPVAAHAFINYNPVPKMTETDGGGGASQGGSFTGNASESETSSEDIKFGETFEERPTLQRLRPFEGDTILESRWGSSIRFGSTVSNSKLGSSSKTTWSNPGNITSADGDPIIIIRNGVSDNEEEDVAKVEDINEEKSAIWLTSNQFVELEYASDNFQTYGHSPKRTNAWSSDYQPEEPAIYDGRQVIINSGRLIFNAGDDSILMASKKSIGLMTDGSIHLNATKPIVLEGEKVHIGLAAKQPALLGNDTVNFLNKLLSYLMIMDVTTSAGPGLCGPGAAANFSGLMAELEALKTKVARVE